MHYNRSIKNGWCVTVKTTTGEVSFICDTKPIADAHAIGFQTRGIPTKVFPCMYEIVEIKE